MNTLQEKNRLSVSAKSPNRDVLLFGCAINSLGRDIVQLRGAKRVVEGVFGVQRRWNEMRPDTLRKTL